MIYDIDIGHVAEADKKRSRARAGGRLSDPSIKLARVAQEIQRERLAAGLAVNPLGPSEEEVRKVMAAEAKAKREAGKKPEISPQTSSVYEPELSPQTSSVYEPELSPHRFVVESDYPDWD